MGRRGLRWVVIVLFIMVLATVLYVFITQFDAFFGPGNVDYRGLTVTNTVSPSMVNYDPLIVTDKPKNVTYTIIVKNNGNATLFNLTLVDSIYGSAPKELIPQSLPPEESFTWSFKTTIQCRTHNTATATGVDASGRKASASDDAWVYVRERPFSHLPG